MNLNVNIFSSFVQKNSKTLNPYQTRYTGMNIDYKSRKKSSQQNYKWTNFYGALGPEDKRMANLYK